MSDIADKFAPGAYNLRETYPGMFTDWTSDYLSRTDVTNYFTSISNQSLKWLYFRNQNAEIFNRVVKEIPLAMIMAQMQNLAEPVYMNYIETTENEEFMKVYGRFFNALFWHEDIYVSYNFFDDEERFIFDPEPEHEFKELEALKAEGGFDIWIKNTGDPLDKDVGFTHLRTSRTMEIPEWRELLIPASWNGYSKNNNFTDWFQQALEWLVDMKILQQSKSLMTKRIHITGRRGISGVVEQLNSNIESVGSHIWHDNYKDGVDVLPRAYLTGPDLESLYRCTFQGQDRKLYELGRVANTNPKGERLTTGENYKDIIGIACRQSKVLTQLKVFAKQVSTMWGIDLEFAVCGVPERQMLEQEVHTAPNPNTFDKEQPQGEQAGGNLQK